MNARLTHEDRRRIAVWLADGLGYAEIGRRLGRTTSTISREIARNGTADGYLAAHAQQSAAHRARRRGPARPGTARPADAVRTFVDQLATSLAGTGMPRMTARVLACLLTADTAGLTSADLVGLLQVSPASVSKSIGSLEDMDLVVRQPDPGARRERYVIDDDVWLRAWQTDTGAHGTVAAAAERGVALFGADTIAGARLARMGRFFGGLNELMSASTVAQPVVHDALTVLAALVHAGRPLTATALTTALDWPADRVHAALAAIEQRPAIADPLAVCVVADRTYAVAARPDRLSPLQRKALSPDGRAGW